MSRLRKKATMDINSFQSVINQTSKKGRDILKTLEDFKFTLEQTARLVNNNQQLAQGMITKRKSVDEISNKLYQIVFDIENMDISEAFQNQSQPVLQDAPAKDPNQQPSGTPGAPGTSPMNGQPPAGPAGQPPMPGQTPAPGGTPPTPPTPPAPPSGDKEDSEDSKDKEDNKSDEKSDNKDDKKEEK